MRNCWRRPSWRRRRSRWSTTGGWCSRCMRGRSCICTEMDVSVFVDARLSCRGRWCPRRLHHSPQRLLQRCTTVPFHLPIHTRKRIASSGSSLRTRLKSAQLHHRMNEWCPQISWFFGIYSQSVLSLIVILSNLIILWPFCHHRTTHYWEKKSLVVHKSFSLKTMSRSMWLRYLSLFVLSFNRFPFMDEHKQYLL